MRSVALFDLDKTIYNTHTFFPILKWFADRGLVSQKSHEAVMEELVRHRRGETTYTDAARAMFAIMGEEVKGKSEKEFIEDIAEFFKNNLSNFYPYFAEILPKLKESHDVFLITTNVGQVAEAVKEMFELDGVICTNFEVKNGKFTGKMLTTLADGKHVVSDLLKKYGKGSIAVGDSENDIGMLELVDHPFCINPSPELLPVARKRGWKIVTDKNAGEEISKVLE